MPVGAVGEDLKRGQPTQVCLYMGGVDPVVGPDVFLVKSHEFGVADV